MDASCLTPFLHWRDGNQSRSTANLPLFTLVSLATDFIFLVKRFTCVKVAEECNFEPHHPPLTPHLSRMGGGAP